MSDIPAAAEMGVPARPTGPGRALVVHADPVTRQAVTDHLRARGVVDVTSAGSVEDRVVRQVAGDLPGLDAWDLVLLQAGGPGHATVSALTATGWDDRTRVVLIADQVGPALVRHAMTAGMRCVLTPGTRPKGPGPDRTIDVGTGAPVAISAREAQVLQLVADGLDNQEIAGRLGISAQTVKSHFSGMRRRLGSADRARLVMLALRAGVIR